MSYGYVGGDTFFDDAEVDVVNDLPISWGGGPLAQLSDEVLIAMANADLTPESRAQENPKTLVRRVRQELGRKFEVVDLTDTGDLGQDLYEAACEWLITNEAKDHDLDFVKDIARKFALGGGLTDGQAKGVLNCMAAVRREQNRGYGPSIEQLQEARRKPKVELDDDDRSYEAYEGYLAEQAEDSVKAGYYTIVTPNHRRTLRVGKWDDDRQKPGQKIRFISCLIGPNNSSDYQWFAIQRKGHTYPTVAKKFQNGHGTWIEAMRVLFEGGSIDGQMAYAQESGRCTRCNRMLTVPGWEARQGMGPDCWDHETGG